MRYRSTLRPIPILHLDNVSWTAILKGNTYTSTTPVRVYEFLERQDHKIFRKFSYSTGHPLLSIIPRVKPSSYHLKKKKLIINLRLILCVLKTVLLTKLAL